MKRYIPHLIIGFFALYLIAAVPQRSRSDYDLKAFGQVPVLHNGRIKPLDSVARNALLIIQGKQTLKTEAGQLSPTQWLLDVISVPGTADSYPIFRLDNPEVKTYLGFKDESKKYFAFEEFASGFRQIVDQNAQAIKIEAQIRSPFQRAIVQLHDRLNLYFQLKNGFFGQGIDNIEASLLADADAAAKGAAMIAASSGDPNKIHHGDDDVMKRLDILIKKHQFLERVSPLGVIAPASKKPKPSDWITIGKGYALLLSGHPMPPQMMLWAQAIDARQNSDPTAFNAAISQFTSSRMVRYEAFINHFAPFYRSIVLYLVCFMLVIASFLVWQGPLGKASFYILSLAFSLHTVGLISRMLIQGRPPVTNLYSSAVFVGWGAIVLGIILERLFKNRIGTLVSAVIGFCSLIVAHHLSLQGDTLEMMQAVLDSNFWLSTHVVTITIGYSACFLAGFLGIVYILRGLYSRASLSSQNDLCRMVYGIICFALFFSFIGTVLGGIWADQSWGRFWGWDPKENGALLIVIWNAMILHARLGGMIQKRGLMVMAIFGNIITSFSWFGVNMLGIGLHSYGFMDKAFVWLLGFAISQLFFITLGLIPLKYWASHHSER